MRLVIGVLIGLLIGATGVTAADRDGPHFKPSDSAKALAMDYLAPLVRPDAKPVGVRVRSCRAVADGWRACRIYVRGQSRCTAAVRVRPPAGDTYMGWVPKMRCRS